MTNEQLAIYLGQLQDRLDTAITEAREFMAEAEKELCALEELLEPKKTTKNEWVIPSLVDKANSAARPKNIQPAIPALYPFEAIFEALDKDIKTITQ